MVYQIDGLIVLDKYSDKSRLNHRLRPKQNTINNMLFYQIDGLVVLDKYSDIFKTKHEKSNYLKKNNINKYIALKQGFVIIL